MSSSHTPDDDLRPPNDELGAPNEEAAFYNRIPSGNPALVSGRPFNPYLGNSILLSLELAGVAGSRPSPTRIGIGIASITFLPQLGLGFALT